MSETERQSDSDSSEQEESEQPEDDEEQEELVVQFGDFQPYQDEPVGLSSDEEERNDTDEDGLTPAVLESRFEREVPVNSW